MPGSRRRRAAVMLRLLEWALLAVGCLAIGWYINVGISAAREQAALSRELESARLRGTIPSGTIEAIAARAPIARIEMPRLKLSAAAREGVDTRTLRGAVGHVPGTALPGEPGNSAFAAHRDTFFRPLKDVRAGDEVVLTTPGGVYRYAVATTRIVEPSDVSVLAATADPTLTLVTCYPFDYVGTAPQRFIVRATLTRR
jgi:sortase A